MHRILGGSFVYTSRVSKLVFSWELQAQTKSEHSRDQIPIRVTHTAYTTPESISIATHKLSYPGTVTQEGSRSPSTNMMSLPVQRCSFSRRLCDSLAHGSLCCLVWPNPLLKTVWSWASGGPDRRATAYSRVFSNTFLISKLANTTRVKIVKGKVKMEDNFWILVSA